VTYQYECIGWTMRFAKTKIICCGHRAGDTGKGARSASESSGIRSLGVIFPAVAGAYRSLAGVGRRARCPRLSPNATCAY